MKKRLLSPVLCGVPLCGALAGCGGNEMLSTPQEPSSSQTAEELKIPTTTVSAELNTFYPLNMDVQNSIGTKLCYRGLVNYENGKIVPCLTESWGFSDGGKALILHLKEGVTSHDGTSFNAEAVKTDFELAYPNSNFSDIFAVAKVESIEVVDEHTVTFHYPDPYFAYPMDSCYPETTVLVSPAVLEEGNYQSMNGVVGTGSYVYEETVNGDYVRSVRNKSYWGEQPYYDEVIVKYIPDALARLQTPQSGEIDLIYGSAFLTWDDYQQAISLPNIAGAVAESDSKIHSLMLDASGVLSDLKVREAVAYAIDKETPFEGLTYGKETPADCLFPDGIPHTDVKLNVVRTYDPRKASAFLDEAGQVLNKSTGIREKDGQILPLKCTYDFGDVLNKSPATMVKGQLAAVGVNVETEDQEMMTWWQEGVAGNHDPIMWNTEQSYTSPHNYFIPMLPRSPRMPSLPAVEGSDELSSLIEEFQTVDDSVRVQKIFGELLNFDNDNVLDLSLLFVKDIIVYSTDKIVGHDFSSMSMFFDVRLIQPVE